MSQAASSFEPTGVSLAMRISSRPRWEPLEQILQEITAFETQLSRRAFIGTALLIAVASDVSLAKDDQRFIDVVAATLINTTASKTLALR